MTSHDNNNNNSNNGNDNDSVIDDNSDILVTGAAVRGGGGSQRQGVLCNNNNKNEIMIIIITKVTTIITIIIIMMMAMTCRQRGRRPQHGQRPAAFTPIQTAPDATGLTRPARPPPDWDPPAPTANDVATGRQIAVPTPPLSSFTTCFNGFLSSASSPPLPVIFRRGILAPTQGDRHNRD